MWNPWPFSPGSDMRNPRYRIEVDVPPQPRTLRDNEGRAAMQVPVSTARNGVGEERGTEKTPRGSHYIRAKIGAEEPGNSVFVWSRPTGEAQCARVLGGLPS